MGTYKEQILEALLEGRKLCSNDVFASNSNQYFNEIKKSGIELIEVYKDNISNKGHHKERWLNQSIENIERAKNLLEKLKQKNRI